MLLSRLARTIWSLNRGAEAVAVGERALALLPSDDPDRLRPELRGWLARTRFLRGRFRPAAQDAEIALAEATAVGNTLAEAEALNTLGMARVALGDAEGGIASLQRAIAVGRGIGDIDSEITAYSTGGHVQRDRAHQDGAVHRPRGTGRSVTPARSLLQLDESRRRRNGLRSR